MPMRVGVIAPPWLPVPPPAYGGTEVVVDNLVRGLRRLGAEVVLHTVGTSRSPVPIRYLYDRPATPMNDTLAETAHVVAAYTALQHDAAVDVVHDHTVAGPVVARALGFDAAPVVVTNHGPFGPRADLVFSAAPDATVVALSASHASASTRPDAVVHHGIDLTVHRPGPGDGGYLLFIGRMSPDKGVHRAVRIARAAGRRLLISAKMHTPEERDYYEHAVRPLMAPGDDPPAELGPDERVELARHAVALLDPIRWPEPFGLVMVEALAAGTPVLAFPHGAAREIVRDGVTGFLCADEAAMVAAVGRVGQIDRAACRRDAERRFDMMRMARDYLGVYRTAMTRHAARHTGRGGSAVAGSAGLLVS